MTQNTLLRFEGSQVRMIEKDGEPWWVAKDVCAILGIKNNRQALARLEDDEKGVTQNDTPGGRQSVQIVNEPGLYHLIDSSEKPEAKAFKRWIRHDVLPTIRKTGIYVADEQDLGLVRSLMDMRNRLERIESVQGEAARMALSLPEPLGVLPETTNAQAINKAARVACQQMNMKPGAFWNLVWTELEFRFRVRIGARKKRAGWKGSTITYAIHVGYADKVYEIIFDMLKRYLKLRVDAA